MNNKFLKYQNKHNTDFVHTNWTSKMVIPNLVFNEISEVIKSPSFIIALLNHLTVFFQKKLKRSFENIVS